MSPAIQEALADVLRRTDDPSTKDAITPAGKK
jgi:hypothetical protein